MEKRDSEIMTFICLANSYDRYEGPRFLISRLESKNEKEEEKSMFSGYQTKMAGSRPRGQFIQSNYIEALLEDFVKDRA